MSRVLCAGVGATATVRAGPRGLELVRASARPTCAFPVEERPAAHIDRVKRHSASHPDRDPFTGLGSKTGTTATATTARAGGATC